MQHKLPVDTVLVPAPGEKRTRLARDLAEIGIRTIPADYVERHKRKMLDEVRGDMRRIAPFTTLFFRALEVISLASFFHALDRRGIETGPLPVIWVIASMAGLVASPLPLWNGHMTVGLLLAIPPLALATLAWFESERVGLYIRLLSYWTLVPLKYHHRKEVVPGHVLALARRAATVPGVRMYVERLHVDPLLVVLRGYGPFRQKAHIAGWQTGDPRLDDFAS